MISPLFEIDDELPPWIGERFRDTVIDIQVAAIEAEQDQEDTGE